MTKEDLDTLERLHRAATAGRWEPGWNVRYFDKEENGQVSMCGRGPDSPVLRREHPRYRDLVADQSIADGESIAANHNAMDYLLSAARREKVLREALEAVALSLDVEDFWTAAVKARAALEGANTNERPHRNDI